MSPGMAGKVKDVFKVYKKQMVMILYCGFTRTDRALLNKGKYLHVPFGYRT